MRWTIRFIVCHHVSPQAGRRKAENGRIRVKVRRTYPDDKRKRGWTHDRKEEKGNGRKATNKSDKEKQYYAEWRASCL